MKEIALSKENFKEFNQDDQFGFFYDDSGFPRDDADETFEDDVNELYSEYDQIIVDSNDTIYGLKAGKKEVIMENVIEAYYIAKEVTE